MATLEVATLLSPTTGTPAAAIIAGTGVATDGSAAAPSFFNRLLQASIAGDSGDPATDATLPGLAALNAGRWRTFPADPVLPTVDVDPAGADPVGLDLQQAAMALTGAAALDKDGLGESDAGEADVAVGAGVDDTESMTEPDLTVWPGLPLFIEARAALRQDESPAGQQPTADVAVNTVAMETNRLQFRLQSTRTLHQEDRDGRITESLLSGNLSGAATAEGDGDQQSTLTGEIDAIMSTVALGDSVEPGLHSGIAQLATSQAAQMEQAELGSLKLHNPVAQLATGQAAQMEPGSLKLHNPVAQLATADKLERTEPGPVNPVAQLATADKLERTEPGPVNPVAQLATADKLERTEPGPVNPVAQLAAADKTSPPAAAKVETAPVTGHNDKTPETARDRAAVALSALQFTHARSSAPQPLIAEPFTGSEFRRLTGDPAAPAEPASFLDDAPPPNGVRPERPATPLNPLSAPLPDTDQTRRSPPGLTLAPTAPRQDPAIPEAATMPRIPEAPASPTSGSPLSVGLPSTVATTRPDPATPLTALPTAPDVIDLNQKNWGRTLGQQLNWMVNNQLQQAEIRVNPPDLGPIELRVSLQHNQTSVTFFCHEAAVREALETALPRLREMLDSQGITLNQAQVSDQSLARQQAGYGGQPAFSQRDDRPPAHPSMPEAVANEPEPRSYARRLPGTVDDYA